MSETRSLKLILQLSRILRDAIPSRTSASDELNIFLAELEGVIDDDGKLKQCPFCHAVLGECAHTKFQRSW
jgi:hypothetical protein